MGVLGTEPTARTTRALKTTEPSLQPQPWLFYIPQRWQWKLIVMSSSFKTTFRCKGQLGNMLGKRPPSCPVSCGREFRSIWAAVTFFKENICIDDDTNYGWVHKPRLMEDKHDLQDFIPNITLYWMCPDSSSNMSVVTVSAQSMTVSYFIWKSFKELWPFA